MFAGRLEGKINNVRKVVYLFGDYHHDTEDQTECEDVDAIDLHKYIFSTLRNKPKNKIVDVFFETYKNNPVYNDMMKKKLKYIWQMNKHLQKSKDKVEGSNLRLHYVDFRKLIYDIINVNHEKIDNYWTEIDKKNSISSEDISTLIDYIQEYKEVFIKLEFDVNRQYSENDEVYGKIYYYYNKIIKNYNNNQVKNKIFNSEIYATIKQYFTSIITNFDTALNMLNPEELGKVQSQMALIHKVKFILYEYISENYHYFMLNYFVYVIDIYTLRRLLDKDYVNTVIIYTGFTHTLNYTYTLIKDFDFTLTNVTDNFTIEQINNLISNKNTHIETFQKSLFPEIIYQCINLGSFPDDFV
jgi:hypothetical protein